jgi:hypothetical protein
MSTSGDGRRNTLDWNEAQGKTKMLSVHGDKGKGHKVVFFMGLTEGSIPRKHEVNKPTEIIAESILNVGITRSTKYLFIGFTHSYPSRYLQSVYSDLNNVAYISWEPCSDDVPEPYSSIIQQLRSDKMRPPRWTGTYTKTRVDTGIKTNLEVKGDLSKDFDRVNELYFNDQNDWLQSKKFTQFGRPQQIIIPLKEDHYIILGI